MYDVLYEVFRREIRNAGLTYRGNKIWYRGGMNDGRENIFWHLTSREEKPVPRRKQKYYPEDASVGGGRFPDFRRCERLRWIKALLEHVGDVEVLDWDYEEGNGEIYTYIWLKAHDFVVIMERMTDGTRRLITSF